MTEPANRDDRAFRDGPASFPPELEARIAILERSAPNADFDAPSWFWMLLLGVVTPLALLIAGWWA